MSATSVPILSIGMPAYNSARTLRSSIDSLLDQTFTDFELIISDNASSDATCAIVEEYAARDPRIVALKQPQNIGANGNYSAVFRAAKGRYFKWASSNDWCAPEFLGRCVARLENHPEAVLVAPRACLFTESPADAVTYPSDVPFDQPDAVDRLVVVCRNLALNNVLNGVVRTEVLRQTRLIDHYPGADIVLVGHIALLGKIVLLDEHLFYRRMDRETATHLMTDDAIHLHHYPKKTLRALFPNWRFMTGWLRAIMSSPLSNRDTRRAMAWALRMAYWRRAGLQRDVMDAVAYPFRG